MINVQAAVDASRLQRNPQTKQTLITGSVIKSENFFESFRGEHDKTNNQLVLGSNNLSSFNIDVSWLSAASDSYKISADPRDYVLVEVPLITVDIPNRNMQAFPYEEVTYFDPLYGRMIYSTFVGKPTHIDHQNKDPLKAKGVNFDAALRYVPKYNVWKIFVLSGFDRTKDKKLADQILKKERTGYCLVEGTHVSTGRGLVPIESFSNTRSVQEPVSINEVVQTPNGNGTAKYWYYSGKKECHRITTSSGYSVAGSKNQMVLKLKPDLTLDWAEMENVRDGDYVATPRKMMEVFPDILDLPSYAYERNTVVTHEDKITCDECARDVANLALHIKFSHPNLGVGAYRAKNDYHGPLTSFVSRNYNAQEVTIPKTMASELGALLGYLVSEGWVSWVKDTYCIGMRSTSRQQASEFKEAFEAVFGVKCSTSDSNDAGKQSTLQDGTVITSRSNGIQIYKYSRVVGEFLKLIAGEGVACNAKEKAVPWSIMQAPRESVVQFLRSLYLGDGSGSFREDARKTNVYYHSSSVSLRSQVRLLLQRLGIQSLDRDENIVIQSAENVEKFHKIVFGCAYDTGKLPKGVDRIPYLLEHLPDRTEESRSSYTRDCHSWLTTVQGQNFLSRAEAEVRDRVDSILNMDVFWDQVVCNEDIGERETFDLTVEGPSGSLNDPSCFVADGIYCHNSMGALVESFVPICSDSLVSTSRGLVQAKDFVSSDEVDSGVRTSKSNGSVYQGVLPAKRVNLSNGMNLTLAGNHPLLVLRPDLTMEWVEADKVEPTDYVAASSRNMEFPEKLNLNYSPMHSEADDGILTCRACGYEAKHLAPHLYHTHGISADTYKKTYGVRLLNSAAYLEHTYPTEMFPELAKLLGYFLSEGSFGRSDVMVGFINTCSDLWQDYDNAFKSCFGIESKAQTSVFPAGVKDFFEFLGVDQGTSKTKKVPWSILQAPRESVIAFLRAFWEGDGSARAIPGAVTYHSSSKELMEQIQLMLIRLGIVSDIEVKTQRTNLIDESDPDLVMYNIRIFGKNVDKFKEVIGAISSSRKLDLENLSVSYRQDTQPGEHIPYLKEICDDLYTRFHKGSGWYDTNTGVKHLHLHRLDLKDNSVMAYGHFDKWGNLLPFIGILDSDLAERISMLLNTRYNWVQVASNEDLGIDLPMYCVADAKDGSFVANGLVTHNCSISGQVDTNKPSKYTKGEVYQGKLCYQLCVGANFIENSSVADPADITAETEMFWG